MRDIKNELIIQKCDVDELSPTYVTMEQAMLLKELGFPMTFDKKLRHYYITKQYNDDVDDEERVGELVCDHNAGDGWSSKRFKAHRYVLAPNLDTVARWIRKTTNLLLEITTDDDYGLEYMYSVSIVDPDTQYVYFVSCSDRGEMWKHDEALSHGIDFVLGLIKDHLTRLKNKND